MTFIDEDVDVSFCRKTGREVGVDVLKILIIPFFYFFPFIFLLVPRFVPEFMDE